MLAPPPWRYSDYVRQILSADKQTESKGKIQLFKDRSVLITGGTGSFGRQYTKTLIDRYKPSRIVIYSRDELKQYEMAQQFDYPGLRFFIGDVRDQARLKRAMEGIDYVIHAAALKQVPAAEYNPIECIRTNVDGAQNVIEAALATGVRRLMALSTDKAANPVNLYGASKLASDKLFIAANNMAGADGTRFAVVRYGNVVGSRGSVVPFFKKLLAEGATRLPVTHPEMTRFWITLQEGVDFVLKNFERMFGGELFVPKIPSVRILDLVEAYAGNRNVADIIGIRPGEKLHEVMCPRDDSHLTLEFDDHYVIRPTIQFYHRDHDFSENGLSEKGVPVEQGFEYNSGVNERFLTVEEIREVDRRA